jgi:hypothetical protein
LEGSYTLLQVAQVDLVSAMAVWGAHEANGRERARAQFDLSNKLACADFSLRFRAPLWAAILQQEPVVTLLVEFEPQESDAFVLFDGRSIDDWIQAARISGASEWQHFRGMVAADGPPGGSLIGSARRPPPTGIIGPIVLWDGWHRGAAWRERWREGKVSRMSAYLILTAK